MLKIEGRTFMNIQEAVQWLLDNNALPFQSSANYQANTEIGLGTIVNPSPAKVRIGSLIFFADSKVSTVVGITDTGFICSDQYNNLVDDIAYVTNVAINASGHLITTLSDGQTIDAGQIKQVSSFSINASQHLIVTYNDGTTEDLGAIFSGNVTIGGNLTVTGSINGEPNPSVKPIYYHGISLQTADYVTAIINLMILNNSNAYFTISAIRQWILDIISDATSLLINCNGNVKEYLDISSVSRSGHVVAIFTNQTLIAEEKIQVILVNDSGVRTNFVTTLTDFFNYFVSSEDRRNKIN